MKTSACSDEPVEDVEPALHVEPERALPRVRREEHHAAAGEELGAPGARLVAALGMLDLDDVGAERARASRCSRARQRRGDVHHLDPRERPELHRREPTAVGSRRGCRLDPRADHGAVGLRRGLRAGGARRGVPGRPERVDGDRGRRARGLRRPRARLRDPRRRGSARSSATRPPTGSAARSGARCSVTGSSAASAARRRWAGPRARSTSAAAT